MDEIRKIKYALEAVPTLEGAGVHLKRAFGSREVPDLDPFLLLDDFHSRDPEKYIKGFPWHPHRGIETITYVLHGRVEHGDSMGNTGVIASGDVQWMTAGSGIVHQEMPKGDEDALLWGFQLWANLPASHKMMPPRYREIKKDDIQDLVLENGVRVKVIAGQMNGVEGPVKDIVIDPQFLDVSLPARGVFDHGIPRGHKAFAYAIEGEGDFEPQARKTADPETLVLFEDGERVNITAKGKPLRFLLISGKPLNEPISWQGPIVMNSDEELETAFREYRNGTFLKHRGK
jgi:redox-sensitive bicupin YhaK (pirin superfamily)